MSKYIPTAGQLFYAESLPFERHVQVGNPFQMTVTAVRERDRSYDNSVFRAVAVDDWLVVAERQTDRDSTRDSIVPPIQRLRRADFVFRPVGPDVAKALGLAIDTAVQE